MKTFTTLHNSYGRWSEGKTHIICSTTKPNEPADMEYISLCGLKASHLLVAINQKPANCKKCKAAIAKAEKN